MRLIIIGLSMLFAWLGFAAQPSHPNVLLIITDDQGYGDLGCHGNNHLKTPNLDKLAAAGASFERFYVSPVCAPTRASLLTGRYYLRTGVHGVTRGYETMRAEEVTIAEVFKAAGYVTGCFGKWHNGAHYPYDPNGQGFDEFIGFCAGHWSNYFDTMLDHNGGPILTRGYIADALTDEAIKFIRKNRSRPFFCYVPFNTPHSPFQAPDAYFDKYKAMGLDDELACVYGMCENIDDNVGRLLKELDELALADNTVVVFLTDNGPNTDRFNAGMKGRKGSVHEGGVRVPLFMRWTGHVKPGLRLDQIAADIDLLPTLAQLCGVPAPQTVELDGLSLAPLFDGKTDKWPDRMLFAHWSRGASVKPDSGAVRTQRWRAVFEGGQWQLYDMISNPGQEHDVAAQQLEVVNKLSSAYQGWFDKVTKDGFGLIPIPVGHPDRPNAILPGHEAFLEKANDDGISYSGPAGWANEWIDNWTSTDAYPWWPIDVTRAGRCEVILIYACPKADVGSKIRVEIGGKHIETTVVQPYDHPHLPSPDRIQRKEAYDRRWTGTRVGLVDLPKGRSKLAVKALTKPGQEVIELKAVGLRWRD